MGSLHERNRSVWAGTTPETAFPALEGPVDVDVAVVGGGITGLTTAFLLKEAGATVALVEAGRVASGTTGYTTAKVTSLHGLSYAELLAAQGEEKARQYGAANQAAVGTVAGLVERLRIDCDFERQAAYTYTEDPERVGDVVAEVEAATRLGLPAGYVETSPLPYPIRAAVRFDDQAQFHPRRYCLALAEALPGGGCHLFEDTRALDVAEEADRVTVRTDRGAVVAKRAVVATLLPFVDLGGFFAKTAPYRSYALAVRVGGDVPQGMHLGADEPTRSVRTVRFGDGHVGLVLGGESHKVGQGGDTRAYYERLESWARERFAVASVDYRWSAQDYVPVDAVPYVGRSPRRARTYVATGFKKWGMSNGTAAAMILADAVLGRDNPWAEVFDATRVDAAASAKEFVTENLDVGRHFVAGRVARLLAPSAEELAPGDGHLVELSGEKVAAYRDPEGALHAVSATCTHLGCTVTWNAAETTWDCPCHGSRFTTEGRVLQGPAVEDLTPVAVEDEG